MAYATTTQLASETTARKSADTKEANARVLAVNALDGRLDSAEQAIADLQRQVIYLSQVPRVPVVTPPGAVVATFPGAYGNSPAGFRTAVADMSIDRLEIDAGTYTGWHIGGSAPETTWTPDRTARPLVITTAAGAAVIFDGTGVGGPGDGWLYPGDWRTSGVPAQVGWITIDGTLNGGTITIQNYAIASQGLINPIRATHFTVDHIRVRNCNPTTASNSVLSWCVYVHMNGASSASDNCQFDGWDVIGPSGTMNLNGVQCWQSPGCAGLNVRNWLASDMNRGLLAWDVSTGVLMEGWSGSNFTKPLSTDGVASGTARNNTFTGSGSPTLMAPFTDGGGNSW